MKLTVKVKLQPTPEQAALLMTTLERANTACDALSAWAWAHKTFGRYDLHHEQYHSTRATFNLSAQIVVRCIAKVSDAYAKDRKRLRRFKPHGALPYDARILSWRAEDRATAVVSIWTVAGRLLIPFVCGDRDWDRLGSQRGETDLVVHDGVFYLHAACEVKAAESVEVDDILGVDLGVRNIAVDSDGDVYAAPHSHLNTVRHRNRRLRRKLQAKGTKSAKRLLKRRSGKERRFAEDVNHCISKRIVTKAQDTGRGIALEDLGGLRDRVTVGRSRRDALHTWSFRSLQFKIEYKATLVGVPVTRVDPRNTSRICPACGHCARSNRRSQSSFRCVVCSFAGHADHVAAVNICGRAVVNQPHVSTPPGPFACWSQVQTSQLAPG